MPIIWTLPGLKVSFSAEMVSIERCVSILDPTCDGITKLAGLLRTPMRAFTGEKNQHRACYS